ncbi:uncharacterized protein LOC120479473 [Pimephales promelas]|uniref:uncharacterized protein LOC120479473 n=1 Tax=Pimephales promelas TaxID=90988 RepID=UPI0019556CEA|nr:uncharacterized protein LOC120479473 [Pimephales promelas]KAG1950713.1 butyrophilin-like protein [Pimephales promelas]
MYIKCIVVVAILLVVADGFTLRGPSAPLVAPLGSSLVLPCYTDKPLPVKGLEVEWRRADSETLVHLFLEGESRPEVQQQDYQDRAHFFTDQIQHGNFSLRLDNLRAEDKGEYTCKVYSQQDSGETEVHIKDVGFSSRHITVLFFCVVAGFGAVLLLCCLIYCRVKNTENSRTIWNLHLSLVFCPNVCMFFAFILWALTEGFLHETVTCCALFILRPVMLIWALSYLNYLKDNIKTWIRFFRITSELTVFTVVVYSVLFAYGWRKSAHDTDWRRHVGSGLCFAGVLLLCLILSGKDLRRLCSQERPRRVSSIMPTLGFLFGIILFQLFQLFSSFGFPSLAFFAVALVQHCSFSVYHFYLVYKQNSTFSREDG